MSRIVEDKRPMGWWPRALFAALAFVMVPPFVVLAVAPMLLMLLPVAFVGIPFLVGAFANEAIDLQPEPKRVRALQQAHT
ncbi:MAG TPA: hypothetical protein VJR89_39540 [Polyangiales bacterium]|nr:hypothetical protein [Polyangiales bacterium]